MVGIKRKILLIISLTVFLTAESAVKYRTPELKRLAQIVGVDEKALIPGTNHIGNYTLILDDSMTVRNVGLNLFSEEVKQMGNRQVLDFVERYFLQLAHPAPNSSADLMIKSDGIIFQKGKWQDIKKITSSMPFNLSYHLMRYTVSWSAKDVNLSFSFPGKYQLISGENLIEAESNLPQDILQTVILNRSNMTEGEMKPSSSKDFFVKKGTWLYTESLNGDTYFKKLANGEFEPVVDPAYIKESVSDILLCPDAAEPFLLDVTMHCYGFKDVTFSVPVSRWISYCIQKGCTMYCGVESVTNDGVKATLLAVNQELNFNHLLSVNVPLETIELGKGTIKADLHAFIPTHNIINLKGKYKKSKKREIYLN